MDFFKQCKFAADGRILKNEASMQTQKYASCSSLTLDTVSTVQIKAADCKFFDRLYFWIDKSNGTKFHIRRKNQQQEHKWQQNFFSFSNLTKDLTSTSPECDPRSKVINPHLKNQIHEWYHLTKFVTLRRVFFRSSLQPSGNALTRSVIKTTSKVLQLF